MEQKHCLFTCTTHGEGSAGPHVGISVLFVDKVVTAHFKQLTATPRGNATATYRTTNKELHKEQEESPPSAKDNILMSQQQNRDNSLDSRLGVILSASLMSRC